MTQPEMPPSVLPHAHFLSYVANVSTPTRVRLVASRVTLMVGLLNALAALLYAAAFCYVVYSTAKAIAAGGMWWIGVPGPRPPAAGITFDDVKKSATYILRQNWPGIPLFLLVATSGTLLPLFAPGINRGNRGASMLAFIYFALAIVPTMLTTALVFCAPIVAAGLVGPAVRGNPAVLWWLLLVPVGILLILLMKDLCAFLLWIVRNPATEKPPVTFLPTNPPTGAMFLRR